MENIGNNIRYQKSDSFSTDSVYYRFYDDKGREALVRLSDHDASWFRQQADFDLPVKTPIEQIIRMGKSAIESKEIPVIAFIGDEIAGSKITNLQHGGKYGSSIYLSDGRVVPLHDFEKTFKLKVKDRTRDDERNKIKYRMLLNQLEDAGYFIHRGELSKFTKNNYPVLISDNRI